MHAKIKAFILVLGLLQVFGTVKMVELMIVRWFHDRTEGRNDLIELIELILTERCLCRWSSADNLG